MRIFTLCRTAAAMASLAMAFAQEQPAKPTPPLTQPPTVRGGRVLQKPDRTLPTLTEEQRAKVAEVNKTYSATATPLYTRLATARRELEALVNVDKVDEAAVRAKAKEIADLEADLALARAQRYAKFRAFLPEDQARRLNQPLPMARPFQPALHDGEAPATVAPNK
jgi:Spy/CpxP family protein refolding chaperone